MGIFDVFLFTKKNPNEELFVPDKIQSEKLDAEKKSVGVSEIEMAFLDAYGAFGQDGSASNADIQTIIHLRLLRKMRYREMSMYHICGQVIDSSANDAIITDEQGKVIIPEVDEEVPENIKKIMTENAENLWYKTCDITSTGWELFRKWMIEGEQAIEWVVGEDKKKGIVSYKVLPSATIVPNYEQAQIKGFLQYPISFNNQNYVASDPVKYELNQVGYSNYGQYGTSPLDPLGFLETAVRPYNQLKGLEDSLLVYRISRAPERRVWNVDVGMMTRGKVSEYIGKLIQKFRRKMHYNPSTGEVDSYQQMMSVLDDIWLPKQDGKGTTIEHDGGSIEINKIDDVLLFVRNLYRALKYPKTRWSDDTPSEPFALMKPDNTNPAEVEWSRFCNRCRTKWGQIWLQGWMQQNRLTMSEAQLKWNTPQYLSIRFVEDNLFALNKELAFNEDRMNALATAQTFIKSESNPDGLFAREFVLRNFFKMTDEEYEQNEEMKKKEAEEDAKAKEDENDANPDEFGNEPSSDEDPANDFEVGDDGEPIMDDTEDEPTDKKNPPKPPKKGGAKGKNPVGEDDEPLDV